MDHGASLIRILNPPMKTFIFFAFLVGSALQAAEVPIIAEPQLASKGAFSFPQSEATILCDYPDLRFSVWNNSEYLFAQAVVWKDADGALGKTEDNREIGDTSSLMLDLDGNGAVTAQKDREYHLNPWPHMGGLHYQIQFGGSASSTLKKDSKGSGAVRYVTASDNRIVRVDTFLIPLDELSVEVGKKIRLAYNGTSPTSPLLVNSVGFDKGGGKYYSYHIPQEKYHDYTLKPGPEIDVTGVPEGRNDIPLSTSKKLPMPKIGEMAPEIAAVTWINRKDSPSLKALRGKVVVLDFWATWCGPCIDNIEHLNELQRKYPSQDFQLLSLVLEGRKTIDRLVAKRPIEYPIGLESTSLDTYGIQAIPHAFVIDRTGKIVWHGNPSSEEMNSAIAGAMKKPE